MTSLIQWVDQHANLVLAGAAIIQAVAAGLIAYLTFRLSQSTHIYATLTRDSLELARTHFEREWQPNLHLTLFLQDPAVKLRVINLSRNAVVVTHVFVKIEGKEEIRQFDLDMPLPGLVERESDDLTVHIQKMVEPDVPDRVWSGMLHVSVGFRLTEVPRPSRWVSYEATMRNGYVDALKIRKPSIVWERSNLAPLDEFEGRQL